MEHATRRSILERLSESDVVLDIGGWADPFERADWVMDALPYETRGYYERRGWAEPGLKDPERFSQRTWIERDICDREPYPFEDGEVDFVVCAQTLEDVRDPVWVCSEMERIGKAGYIEVPSRREEQSWGVAGPYVGWPHHHWLVDVRNGAIEFVFKPHELHAVKELHFPAGFWQGLGDAERVDTLWWHDSFSYAERIFFDREPAIAHLSEFVSAELAKRGLPPHSGGILTRLKRRISAAGARRSGSS